MGAISNYISCDSDFKVRYKRKALQFCYKVTIHYAKNEGIQEIFKINKRSEK